MSIRFLLRGLSFCLLSAVCGEAPPASQPSRAPSLAGDIATLRAGFRHPPREAGPWVYWMFFENVMSKEEITRELEEMAAAGIAGAELRFLSMHGFAGAPGPGFDSANWTRLGQRRLEYLSPPFVDMLEHACREAHRLGLQLAINLGMGWPPGGPWITDEHRSKHLLSRSGVVQGPKSLRGDLAMPVPPGAMVFAWRIQDGSREKNVVAGSFCDMGRHVSGQNRLEWNVPEGRWLIGVFHYAPGGLCDKGNGPESDPGSRDAVRFHLDHIFSRLQPRLGGYFGSTLVEVASDSWEYERRGDGRYWSPAIFALFPQTVGYEMQPRLHALLGYGPDREQTLADVQRVERETVRRNFFAATTEYLNARTLCHRPQVRGRGLSRDFFEAFADSDVPEIEEEEFLPEAVWTAHTLGKPIVSAEAFTFISGHGRNLELDGQQRTHVGPLADLQREWETNLTMLRRHANAHFARGVNRLQMHSFGYSPLGLPPPGWRIYAEVHLNRNVPWWPYMPSFTEWTARMQWALRSGEPAADTLVYPVRSNPPEGPYNQAIDQPVSAFNGVDAASPYTLTRMQRHGGQFSYHIGRLVLIDEVRTLDEARRILKLVEDGALLACCRTMPDDWSALRSPAAPTKEIQRLLAGFQHAHQQGRVKDYRDRSWQQAVAEAPSVHWSPAARLTFQHRRVADGEIYLLTNWGPAFSGEASFPHSELKPEIWDADTGAALPAAQYPTHGGRMEVSLKLAPHESTLVVFSRTKRLPHAVRCEGGRVVYEADGRLWARFEGPSPCVVELADGQRRELRADLPSPVALPGPWTLDVGPMQGVGLAAPVRLILDRLVSWRALPSLRTYAGTATYHAQFELPPSMHAAGLGLVLELGDVFELADVWLNGCRVATSWFAPHVVELTGQVCPGKNVLRIDVPNVLKNHLETGNYARPSGLLGPVRIRAIGRVALTEDAT